MESTYLDSLFQFFSYLHPQQLYNKKGQKFTKVAVFIRTHGLMENTAEKGAAGRRGEKRTATAAWVGRGRG